MAEESPWLLTLGVAIEGIGDALDSGKPLTKRRLMKAIAKAAKRNLHQASVGRLTEQDRADLTFLRTLARRLGHNSKGS